MLTLSYGYKKPEPGDTGDVFYADMSTNMDQVNNHTHDGTSSAPLAANQIELTAGSWVAVGARPGIYSQNITLATGFTPQTVSLWFIDSNVSGVQLEYTIISSSALTVYTNDSSETYTAYYK